MITAETKAKIVLFKREKKPTDKPGGTYPAVFGSIENSDFKINVSGFLKEANGKKFLSLVIRNENDEQTFSGTFRASDKKGKEGTYYGYISEQFEDLDEQGEKIYSSSDWQLGISAQVRTAQAKNEDERPRRYYAGEVYPLKKRGNTGEQSTATPAEEEALPL